MAKFAFPLFRNTLENKFHFSTYLNYCWILRSERLVRTFTGIQRYQEPSRLVLTKISPFPVSDYFLLIEIFNFRLEIKIWLKKLRLGEIYFPALAALAGPQNRPQATAQQTHEMTVPNELIGCIIGKGGSKIAEIRFELFY